MHARTHAIELVARFLDTQQTERKRKKRKGHTHAPGQRELHISSPRHTISPPCSYYCCVLVCSLPSAATALPWEKKRVLLSQTHRFGPPTGRYTYSSLSIFFFAQLSCCCNCAGGDGREGKMREGNECWSVRHFCTPVDSIFDPVFKSSQIPLRATSTSSNLRCCLPF